MYIRFVAHIELRPHEKDGLVSINVELADRMVAARLAQAATDLLQSNIIAFKSQSARNNLDFIMSQFESKREEFEQIQDSIAVFKDKNLSSQLLKNIFFLYWLFAFLITMIQIYSSNI